MNSNKYLFIDVKILNFTKILIFMTNVTFLTIKIIFLRKCSESHFVLPPIIENIIHKIASGEGFPDIICPANLV